jgi:predicted MPP superfamily phosphohydrolase
LRNARASVFLAAAALVPGLLAFTAFWLEPRTLTVRALAIEAPSWRAAPLRVAFLSDIHVDNVHMPPPRIREIAARVRELSPDIVILGGDYVGGHLLRSGPPEAARSRRSPAENALDEQGLRALGAFSAPLGVYAVMGNHDCWWDCTRVREILNETGVVLLENRRLCTSRRAPVAQPFAVKNHKRQKSQQPAGQLSDRLLARSGSPASPTVKHSDPILQEPWRRSPRAPRS